MTGSDSGLTNKKQMSLEEYEYELSVSENEDKLHEHYLKEVLPKTSPISIPHSATYKEQQKQGYNQVKYEWNHGKYNYTSRWHTKTPNAPDTQGNSWVVERKIPGIGHGPNARRAKSEILIRKDGNRLKWIPKHKWQQAIAARKNGTITKEQEEILRNGHWKG